ncbi:hypothetical protein SIN8267_01540 [Sinobacterium norvegicum]|uniref:Nucleoprotein/polynucleotide-associated enzyme n=1 Tax=Sinobacterium norvegicum TaxID=1641715 RepID=A0ABM9AFC9_9GAMM|nr:DUF2058 domain-containing protein [Sinobacterium norvegicum]CAH0991434.1 hypothetical protein SIN8267_01540 [Sinobacterium norvegicum]
MANSLQDQLLKAGLVDDKKVKSANKAKKKQSKMDRRARVETIDENKVAAQQALAEKADKARQLNKNLNEKALKKAINAQIKQLIERSSIAKNKGDVAFNFTDGSKIKKLYVDNKIQQQLVRGLLAIVKQGDQYEIIPSPVASKIAERDSNRIVLLNELSDADDSEAAEGEDDWYGDYEIPDDLMW